MKKIISLLAVTFLVTGCVSQKSVKKEESQCKNLYVFNASEYMKEDVYKRFGKENNVNIVYEEFESNEAMYTKLSSGVTTYDLIIPSDYMVQNLIEKNLLQKIDKSIVKNTNDFFKALDRPHYDPEREYSVPYFWGNVGLLYNKKVVSEEELEKKGWAILKDPKYKNRVFAYDSERDGFMVALKNLGYSLNTDNMDQINDAVKWLDEMNVGTEPVYVTDQILDLMTAGEKDIAVAYSGDASLVTLENKDMAYYVPKEGTNIWQDNMVIPKNAHCPELANKFINYLLDPKIMKENAIDIGYTPAVQSAAEELAQEEYKGIESFIPIRTENDEIFIHNDKVKKALTELWLKIKVTK